ncbi:MAG: alpha-amylase family glycosyl hydrolase [Verrucomicrobiales bacterium]|nr:alpha-amylase family glycosyl hydrolase [Verrucomicrobiales bacterium]
MKRHLLRNFFTLVAATFIIVGSPHVFADADVSRATARPSPEWLRAGTIYEIFPRHFSVAGDLNGVTARLDELHDLGVNILWIMPIHPIGEKLRKGDFGSPYSIKDYYAVDPNYGTLADFKKLVTGAHQRGMKVIMDIVANHTAWDSVMMTNLSFYKQDNNGKVISPEPGWTDVAGLNYTNPQLRQYMIAMLKYWIQECDVDGFRCDVAYAVPTDFWEQARTQLVKINPDIIMLAEASKPELLTNAFDLDYSWPLLATLNNVLIHDAPASDLQRTWQENVRQFPKGSLHMRMSDDHDEARAVSRYGIRGALSAQVLMFTLDGVPLLYNGMEVGDATESGDPALFDKLPIFWHPKARPALNDIYRDLIKLRQQSPAFCNDRVTWLKNTDQKNVVTFMREDAHEQFVVVINFSNHPAKAGVEVPSPADFQLVKIKGLAGSSSSDFPAMHLGGFEWRIYHRDIPTISAASVKSASVQ